jgi:hypothetical protein
MRKWQQDLGQEPEFASGISSSTSPSTVSGTSGALSGTFGPHVQNTNINGFAEIPEEIGTTEKISETLGESRASIKKLSSPEKFTEGIKIGKYHYAFGVFCVSLALFCILKPFFVQTTQKDRAYESPNLSFVTAFILSALVALGYLLVCD